MILKALYDYYQRKSEELPPFGTIFQQIHFILVIDKDGNFLRFEDRRLNKNEASQFLVKRTGQRTSGIVAKHFYDNISYYCCPVNFQTAQESSPKPFRIGLRGFFFKKQAP